MSLDTKFADCSNKIEQRLIVEVELQPNHAEVADALVSVYIPTKNRLLLLQRAVQSVLDQSYSNVELVVVDDGSTDGTREYLASLAKAGMAKVIFMPTSGGACTARNAAIEIASGEFLTGLDDDDFFMPNRIRLFMDKWIDLARGKELEKVAGLFDSLLLLDPDADKILWSEKLASVDDLSIRNTVGTQIFAPKQHFVGAGLFDPNMPMWQDWDLWLRMAQRYGIFVGLCKQTYVMDARHSGSRISSGRGAVLRKTARLFGERHMNSRPLRRFGLRAIFMHYENEDLRFWEIIGLSLIGHHKLTARYVLRKMIGLNRYHALKQYYRKING